MTPTDSVYEAGISKQPKGTTVEFYISAIDTDGNTSESDKFRYTVGIALEIPGLPLIIVGLIIGLCLLGFFLSVQHR
jgi:hypothetical protein